MSSPRKNSFYKDLASKIRTDRMLQEEAHKEKNLELRMLAERFLRLQILSHVLDDPTVLQECEKHFKPFNEKSD